jgi:hypothetical protein
MLFPTPAASLCDAEGRPYFLWDVDLTLVDFEARLRHHDPDVRAYWTGVLMRQARPDDAITLAGRDAILEAMPRLAGRLGHTEPFWRWLSARWQRE